MKCVVTGGGGFVGKALCHRLHGAGHSVLALARSQYPELERGGVSTAQVDLSIDPDSYSHLLQGVDAVFHVASKVDMWGEPEAFMRNNVTATKNLLRACQAQNVPYLIYTSTPSVVADGTNIRGVDESYPVARSHTAHYPATKALAEKLVRNASHEYGVRTIALRPHLIWGPGDTHLIPTIIRRARSGQLSIVGKGNNIVDVCYIDDCVSAHVLALSALQNTPDLDGNVYFISQDEPVQLWEFINQVLTRSGLDPITRKVPYAPAYTLAHLFELGARLCGNRFEPRLTRFIVSEMATDHYFDISAARKDLGFAPSVSIAEGLDRTFGCTATTSAAQPRKVA